MGGGGKAARERWSPPSRNAGQEKSEVSNTSHTNDSKGCGTNITCTFHLKHTYHKRGWRTQAPGSCPCLSSPSTASPQRDTEQRTAPVIEIKVCMIYNG